jgi:phage regulator Rha-like protein
MLTGSRLVSITADFVRRFAALDETMQLTSDARAFEAAVAARRG